MTHETSTHAWFGEQIGAYLTDGLEIGERDQFEAHAADCAQCRALLAEAKEQDQSLRGLFAGIGPAADFEERVIGRLRLSGPRRFALPRTIQLHPMVMRAAGAAAAAVVLAGLGYGGLIWMQNGRGKTADQVKVASNLRQIGQAIPYSAVDMAAPWHADGGENASAQQGANLSKTQDNLSYSYANPYPDTRSLGSGYRMVDGLQPTFGVAADTTPMTIGNSNNHGKDGQNVLAGMGDSSVLSSKAPAKQTAGYSYQSTFETPKQAASDFFKPGGLGDRSGSLDEKQTGNVLADSRSHRSDDVEFSKSVSSTPPQDQAASAEPVNAPSAAGNGDGNPSTQTPPPPPADSGRKVIRHGEMSFEVDSFDSAFLQISKIAAEEGGFVADSDSEKLDNGKMSGTITVRVPPEHLDTLTLKLRGLGDLKGQKITADDITKEYTDLESELRAAQAMEDRLVEMIKTAKGQVRDLLAVERELGNWREKVEQVTGEINYYNNLVSLSTLKVSLTERDLRQASLASEQETVNMGVETEDVEKARAEAMNTLDDAKARIIQAELKKFDAGQLAATITAEVSPDMAGPVMDHLKQLGRVARLDIDRRQTVANGATALPGVKVERLNTLLQLSLYNLANVSPRQTTDLVMVCPDVEQAYHAIISRVTESGGRIINSNLNRIKPDQTDGTISFDTPEQKSDEVLAQVRALGEVMHLTVTENPDAANVTNAKKGFEITLASLATVAPRESIVSTLMPGGDVASAYHGILTAAQDLGANITTAQLQEQNSQSASGVLGFDVPREHLLEMEKTITDAIGADGRVIARETSRSTDTEHTVDSKVQFNLTFTSPDALQARETDTRLLAVSDVGGAYGQILAAAQQAGAKVAVAQMDQSNPSNPTGQLDVIVPRSGAAAVEKAIADAKAGIVSKSVSRSADLNSTTDDKVELRLTIGDVTQLPPRETTAMEVEVSDPEKASADLQAAAIAADGRIVEQNLVENDRYQAHLVIDVPLVKGSDFIEQARSAGTVKTIEQSKDLSVPEADFAHAKLDITLSAPVAIVGDDTGLWASFKSGLGTSIRGLAFSLELIIIGICLVVPWAAVGWVGWKMIQRWRRKPAAV